MTQPGTVAADLTGLIAPVVVACSGGPSLECDETDFTVRNLLERFDHEFLLSCPYSDLQVVEGITLKHGNRALAHDRPGVVEPRREVDRAVL